MTERPLSDQRHRERARTELGTSFAVEAAAGAGKTSELVARLLSLIRADKAPLDRIVAMTFTEKAAGELNMRVREELEKTLDGQLEAAERRHFSHALDDLGRAAICTIHSFCAGLLRERPAEAAVDPQFSVADEMTASVLRDRVWGDWLEAELAAGNPALLRAVAQGVNLDGRGNTILGLAEQLLDCRDLLDGRPKRPAAIPDTGKLRAELITEFDALLWHTQAHAAGDQAEKYKGELEVARRQLALSGLVSAPTSEATIASLGLRARPLGKQHWDAKPSYEKGNAAHTDLRNRLLATKALLAQDLAAGIADALLGFLDACRRAMDAEGLLDFQDLLLLTRNMLRDCPSARQHFKERYNFLLIDEFQDTDPLQVEIAFFLAERRDRHAAAWDQVELEPGKLFIVGDPKQSIYRFRRADIEIYERAKEAISRQGGQLVFSQSFRPVPGIAAAVNRLFAPVIKRPPDGLYQPDYVALDPHRGARGERVAVTLLYPPPDAAAQFESQDAARRLEARCVAAMIRRIVQEEHWQVEDRKTKQARAVEYRDIAILARTYTSTDHYAEELAAADVPLRIVGGRHFYAAHEVSSLLSALKAIDNPHDGVAVVATLRGPFFGVSDDELLLAVQAHGRVSYLDTAHAGVLGRAAAILRECHARRNDEMLSLFLQAFLERTKALELFSLRPRGEQRVANLLKIVEQARALEATHRVSFRGFVRWLGRLQETEVREAESPASEAGDDFVQFLSIHGAKGLEFPVVFVADITATDRRTASFLVLRDRSAAEGQFAFYIGEKSAGLTTANWPGDEHEKRRADAEAARLLYVATTRARDLLFLLPAWGRKGNGLMRFLGDAAAPEAPAWGQETALGLVYDTRTLGLSGAAPRAFHLQPPDDECPSASARQRLAAREQWQRGILGTLAEGNKGLVGKSPSRLGHGLSPSGDEPEARPSSDLGRRIGSLVHECLERATLDDPAVLRARLCAGAARLALPDAASQQAMRLLDTALDSPLLRRARAASACYHEVPFAIQVEGTLLTGAIDLLFVEGEHVVVVDFKTDAAVDGAQLERLATTYRTQALAYALSVERTLCKPVAEVILFFLSVGREWPIVATRSALEEAARLVASQE